MNFFFFYLLRVCCYSDQTKQLYSSPCLVCRMYGRLSFLFLVNNKHQHTVVLTAFNDERTPRPCRVHNTPILTLRSYNSVCLAQVTKVSFGVRPHAGGIHDVHLRCVCWWCFMVPSEHLQVFDVWCVNLCGHRWVETGRLASTVLQQVGVSECVRGTSIFLQLALKEKWFESWTPHSSCSLHIIATQTLLHSQRWTKT